MGSSRQALRATYTPEQITEYLDYIEVPQNKRIPLGTTDGKTRLAFLNTLMKYHLLNVPFENLEMHYSTHHTITVDENHLFHKIVERRNRRGGYCFEANCFLGVILRSLGYQVLPVGARINTAIGATKDSDLEDAVYGGYTHTLNIVTIDSIKYVIDAGLSARGPTSAIPLVDGAEGRNTGDKRGGTVYRLSKEHIPDNTHSNPEQLQWVYSVRFSDDTKWWPCHCFNEIEFLPADARLSSFFVSRSPTSWFTFKVVCQRFILDEENDKFVGDITLFEQSVKERRYGVSKELCSINSEEDRIAALKKYFGIVLSQPEIDGILGSVTMITPRNFNEAG